VFVPLYAVSRYNGRSGVVWVVENGRLAQRTFSFAERLLDGRALLAETLPAGVSIVTERDASSFREGRAARAGSHL
jgi:HlyD family secretion protein